MAFINFSKGLVASDFIEMLPKDRIVVEILERDKATQTTIDACIKLKGMGYVLAVDDFILDEDNQPLLDLVDIVKVEFPAVSLEDQSALIGKYKNKLKFLAEKIETREEYAAAVSLGYELFQGYFFSKPSMLKSKDIGSINTNIIRILEELNLSEPSYTRVAEIIQVDLGLSYKLLRLVNSAYIAPRCEIKSIKHALNYLGTREMHQWISLMMLKDVQNNENAETVKQALIRGKLMLFLCNETKHRASAPEYFFTCIFSLMDVLLNKSLTEVLKDLPLTDTVKQALLGEANELRTMLDFLISHEKGDWAALNNQPLAKTIPTDQFMHHYVEALKWAKTIANF
jgi:EAL and modified HD-GYP domain-containing signal transduction protein